MLNDKSKNIKLYYKFNCAGDLIMFFSEFVRILLSLPFTVLHVVASHSFPKPLSKSEEEKYLLKLKNGDKNAKNKLINHNLRLVAHITKKYYFSKSEPDDLISIGTIGLIKAINTFNPDKGIRLSSYASRCIENEILMYFRNLKKSSLDISINEPVETDKNGNTLTLMDTIASEDSVIDKISIKLDVKKLQNFLIKCLTPRERIIICMRYGICGFNPLPQREVAVRLGISRSYVSRIEKRAIQILKKSF